MKRLVLSFSLLFLVGCGGSSGSGTIQTNDNSTDTFTYNGLTYKTIKSPTTSKVWLDRNLGSEKVCSNLSDRNCYGDYYQWGRDADGHQLLTSQTTTVVTDKITNLHDKFIYGSSDWTTADSSGVKRSSNWYKSDGSSICPNGFRVPTIQELKEETINIGVNGREDAFNTFLKLPAAGGRNQSDGQIYAQDLGTLIWAVTTEASYPAILDIGKDFARTHTTDSANGLQVRCIKE